MRVDSLPVTQQSLIFEQAVNYALDDAGAPRRVGMTGTQFRDMRRMLDMSQADVAVLFDVCVSTVNRWECDRGGPLPLLAAFAMSELNRDPEASRQRLQALRSA